MAEPDFGSSVELARPALRPPLRRGDQALVPGRLGAARAAPRRTTPSPHSPYRLKRILAFLDPWAHRHDIGYQVAAVADLGRLGRPLRPRPGREPAEALLPARGPHRLHLLHHRRGAGPPRRRGHHRSSTASSSGAGRAPRCSAQRDLRHLPGPRADRAARVPGGGEHERGDGHAADQGADACPSSPTAAPRWSSRWRRRVLCLSLERLHRADARHRARARRGTVREAARMRMLIAGGGTGGHLFPGHRAGRGGHHAAPGQRGRSSWGPTAASRRGWCRPRAIALETIYVARAEGHGAARALLKALVACCRCAFLESWRILRPVPPGRGGGGGRLLRRAGGARGVAAAASPPPSRSRTRSPGFTNRILGQLRAGGVHRLRGGAPLLPARGRSHLVGNPIRAKADGQLPAEPARARTRFRSWCSAARSGAHGLNARVLEALGPPRGPAGRASTSSTRPARADLERVRAGYADAGLQGRGGGVHRRHVRRLRPGARWSSAGPGRPRWPSSRSARRRRSSFPFPSPPTTTRRSTPQALVEAGAALMFRESELTGERLAQRRIRRADGRPGAAAADGAGSGAARAPRGRAGAGRRLRRADEPRAAGPSARPRSARAVDVPGSRQPLQDAARGAASTSWASAASA